MSTLKTFNLYWHNNPHAQVIQGHDVRHAAHGVGLSDDKLNNFLVAWSEGYEPTMQWDSSDCGGWIPKRR